jgi:hypothetical protein
VNSRGIELALYCPVVSRAASPYIKAGLFLAVVVLGVARARGVDLPSCSKELTRCLATCRAIVSRRLAEDSRDSHMVRANQRQRSGSRAA